MSSQTDLEEFGAVVTDDDQEELALDDYPALLERALDQAERPRYGAALRAVGEAARAVDEKDRNRAKSALRRAVEHLSPSSTPGLDASVSGALEAADDHRWSAADESIEVATTELLKRTGLKGNSWGYTGP